MTMRRFLATILCVLGLASPSLAQGTLPVSLTQQFSFTGCATAANACGTPLTGGLLYFYQVGTVASPQQSFQDTGLTILNPWPLVLDANGRVPAFYLANGSVHIRLTDASGVVQFDYPSALVIGPSSGGGGGGGVDPTTIASTGDVKFRLTGETLSGWVKLNALTIGSATSGATGRANADTQNLFIYLWNNCTNPHCPVSGGHGANALADFSANKTITVPDCRGRICMLGLDDMGNSAAGRLIAANVTSGGGDGVTTPLATGGLSNFNLAQNQLPNIVPTFTGNSQSPSVTFPANTDLVNTGAGGNPASGSGLSLQGATATVTFTPTGTISSINGNVAQQLTLPMNPFALGTYFMKL